MTCPLCGETCICVSKARPVAMTGLGANQFAEAVPADTYFVTPGAVDLQNVSSVSEMSVSEPVRPRFVVSQDEPLWRDAPQPVQPAMVEEAQECLPAEPEAADSSEATPEIAAVPAEADADTWRDEVSARLSRYRARRRPRAPRYPSLAFKFEPPSRPLAAPVLENNTIATAAAAPLTCQALAMDASASIMEPSASEPELLAEPSAEPVAVEEPAQVLGKILEFPRWAYQPPESNPYDLADPVVDRPRILEVPEVVPPPPVMGGITIEDGPPPVVERQPGIDMPLRIAPVGARLLAVVVDMCVVAVALALFGFIFYKLCEMRPPMWELISMGIGLPSIFWIGYQYLFVVYCGTTPGLWAAHLRLCRFDGVAANCRKRRSRVLCSVLSFFSLGMGYAWQFLDEDQLCWHERVTRTYLAPSA